MTFTREVEAKVNVSQQRTSLTSSDDDVVMVNHCDVINDDSITDLSSTTSNANYSLNKGKLMKNKVSASKRLLTVTCELKKGHNFVLTFSTGSFEVLRNSVNTFYRSSIAKTRHVISSNIKKDNEGLVESETIRISTGSSSRASFTMNLFRTTCKVLVNGPQLMLFIKEDLPVLKTMLAEQIDFIDNVNVLVQEVFSKGDTQVSDTCSHCNRYCKSRAVLCSRGRHWVHYRCEKLSPCEVINLESFPTLPYACSQCSHSDDFVKLRKSQSQEKSAKSINQKPKCVPENEEKDFLVAEDDRQTQDDNASLNQLMDRSVLENLLKEKDDLIEKLQLQLETYKKKVDDLTKFAATTPCPRIDTKMDNHDSEEQPTSHQKKDAGHKISRPSVYQPFPHIDQTKDCSPVSLHSDEYRSPVKARRLNLNDHQSQRFPSTSEAKRPSYADIVRSAPVNSKVVSRTLRDVETLVIGSSLVKNVSSRILSSSLGHRCAIDTNRGAKIADISTRITSVIARETTLGNVVFVMGGNDVADSVTSVTECLDRFSRIITHTQAMSGARIHVCSVLPRQIPKWFNDKASKVNSGLVDLCSHLGCGFIDVHGHMMDVKPRDVLQDDRIHLSRGGVKLLCDNIVHSLSEENGNSTGGSTRLENDFNHQDFCRPRQTRDLHGQFVRPSIPNRGVQFNPYFQHQYAYHHEQEFLRQLLLTNFVNMYPQPPNYRIPPFPVQRQMWPQSTYSPNL